MQSRCCVTAQYSTMFAALAAASSLPLVAWGTGLWPVQGAGARQAMNGCRAAGANAFLDVAKRVRLTLTKRPVHWVGTLGMFKGLGK